MTHLESFNHAILATAGRHVSDTLLTDVPTRIHKGVQIAILKEKHQAPSDFAGKLSGKLSGEFLTKVVANLVQNSRRSHRVAGEDDAILYFHNTL